MIAIAVPDSLTEDGEYNVNGMRTPKDPPSSETQGKSSLRANATLEITNVPGCIDVFYTMKNSLKNPWYSSPNDF